MSCRKIVLGGCLMACCLAVAGQQVQAGPEDNVVTFWNKLGIPQVWNRFNDARINRFGLRPNAERQLPLKRLGDPANLQSKNPAIKTAAQIKYLGSVGCGCYPGVKEALLAALDDCTEEVRLAAAEALQEAAGCVCRACNKSCCDIDTRIKLADVANGIDLNGCYKESSAEVRAAAARALAACGGPPIPVEQVAPPPREVPQTPAEREMPSAPIPPLPANPTPAPVAPAPERQATTAPVTPTLAYPIQR
jgi:hypothetical protein